MILMYSWHIYLLNKHLAVRCKASTVLSGWKENIGNQVHYFFINFSQMKLNLRFSC